MSKGDTTTVPPSNSALSLEESVPPTDPFTPLCPHPLRLSPWPLLAGCPAAPPRGVWCSPAPPSPEPFPRASVAPAPGSRREAPGEAAQARALLHSFHSPSAFEMPLALLRAGGGSGGLVQSGAASTKGGRAAGCGRRRPIGFRPPAGLSVSALGGEGGRLSASRPAL